MIDRHYKLHDLVAKQKVLVIYGPRRSGKSTLLNHFLAQTSLKYKFATGDDQRTQEILGSRDLGRITDYAAGYDLLALDEAQQIPGIGWGLKMLVDHVPDLAVIATGSASFSLQQQIGEPLTGRKTTKVLYPFSQGELAGIYNRHELAEKLEEFLLYGTYPECVTAPTREAKQAAAEEIANSYLLKDVLALERVRSASSLVKLLGLLAMQVGSQVSLNELATQVRMDVKTVDRYLDILEKGFVLKSVPSFSRNLRKELAKSCKYYFYDTGVRNALISQFNPLAVRQDAGALWENFLMMERLKKQEYAPIRANNYFWRTYDQKEIDLVEERDGKLFGYEFKWGSRKTKEPKLWRQTYPNAEYQVIDTDNYLDFIL